MGSHAVPLEMFCRSNFCRSIRFLRGRSFYMDESDAEALELAASFPDCQQNTAKSVRTSFVNHPLLTDCSHNAFESIHF